MLFKFWTYIFSSIGIIIAIYYITKSRWKEGCWITCISLLIIAGGNLQVGGVNPSVTNSFNYERKIENINDSVRQLHLKVDQTLELRQDISQTVNVINKVEKEIANIKDTIKQFYSFEQNEIFRPIDIDKRVKIFSHQNTTFVYFELKKMPVRQSVILAGPTMIFPSMYYKIDNNIVLLRMSGNNGDIFKDNRNYQIRYYEDYTTNDSLLTVRNMKFQGRLPKGYDAYFDFRQSQK